MSSCSNLRAYADEQFRLFEGNLGKALGSVDVDAVHDARVASRRLSEPLELARRWVKDRDIDRTQRRLRRIRRALAVPREMDVLTASLSGPAEGSLEPGALGRTLDALNALRAEGLKAAKKKCGRGAAGPIGGLVGRVLDQCEAAVVLTGDSVDARGRELVAERASRLLRVARDEVAAADLHRIRLGLKRLRYAVELQSALAGEENEPLIKQFKRVQGLLGDWNDQLQAGRLLSKLARPRDCMIERPDWSAALLAHAAERVRRSRSLADAFVAEWPRFRDVVRGLAAGEDTQET